MTILPCVVLLYILLAHASLLPVTLNDTSIPILDTHDAASTGESRTLWDIIWSCGVTLFAWTWTAIHPNIPSPNDTKITVMGRRLSLMIRALFVPELFITWAALQFFSARQTVRDFNNLFPCVSSMPPQSNETNRPMSPQCVTVDGERQAWTMRHGFFAWMGGFVLYVDKKPYATLTPDELIQFILEESVDMPDISDADIADRSKGDELSKGMATIQLAWFVLQFIARSAQNLQNTLLEVDTLAVAAMTCIAHCFWWKKPKDIGRPWIVHWKSETSSSALGKLFYNKKDNDFHSPVFHLVYPFISLMGIEHVNPPDAIKAHRVSSVGGYGDGKYRDGMITTLIGCFCGMLFGTLHCLGWNYSFRTPAWELLWRGASAIITISPVLFLLSFGYYKIWSRNSKSERSNLAVADVFLIFLLVLILFTLLIYIFARVLLLVLMVLSFLSLPPSAYHTVAWTKFLPHL